MSLLDYLMSSLEKPGRAVRGLLSGNAREGLAALPFSDSLGVTDEDQKVSGHDLLSMLGLDPGDGVGGTLAGIGADVATDPLTYAGGFLAKKLLGGGLRTVGRTAADLLPEEYEFGSRYERLAAGGFPGQLDKVGVMPRAGGPPLAEALAPEAAAADHLLPGADATMPGGELIRQLPHPSMYYPSLPIEELRHLQAEKEVRNLMDLPLPHYNPATRGISGDAVQMGTPSEAADNLLGGWGRVLDDFQRLTPEARADLASGRSMPWNWIIGHHATDLAGMTRLPAVPEALAGQASDQLRQLRAFHPAEPMGNGVNGLVNDLVNGNIRPSNAAEVVAQRAPYLPVDERRLRGVAAAGQEERANQMLVDRLSEIPDQLGVNEMPLRALLQDPEVMPNELYWRMLHAVDPASFRGIEPNISRRVLENPTNGFARQAMNDYHQAIPDVQNQVAQQYFREHLEGDVPDAAGAIGELLSTLQANPGPGYRQRLMDRIAEMQRAAQRQPLNDYQQQVLQGWLNDVRFAGE